MTKKEQTIEFWKFMQKYYDVTVADKTDSNFMKLVGWFLGAIGVLDKEAFLKQFTTTINQKIYIPFKIGEGTDAELWGQNKVLVHEVIHAQQAKKEGILKYAYNYISNKTKRTEYEVEAYRSEMVLDWHFKKTYRKPSSIVESLRSYGLSQTYIDYAQKQLELSEPAIKNNARFHPVISMAIKWMEENGYKP